MKLLTVLGITLLLTSLACGSGSETRLGHSEEYTQRFDNDTEEAAESEPAEQGEVNLRNGSDEDIIAHVKERLANETDCEFLLEADSWVAELMTGFGTYWLVSSGVAHREEHVQDKDSPGSKGFQTGNKGNYDWKYYPNTQVVTTVVGQDDCVLKGK